MSLLSRLLAAVNPTAASDDWAVARDAELAAQAAVAPRNQGNNGARYVLSSDPSSIALFSATPASSGYAITDHTALSVATCYACVSIIAGAIAQLPVHVYRLLPDGSREEQPRNNLWWLLNEQPHARWPAASWKEFIAQVVLLRGDQYTEIVRDNSGRPVSLIPYLPWQVVTALEGDRLQYYVWDIYTNKPHGVDQDDMLHFAGFGYDGVRSRSVIQYAARDNIGNSLAAADLAGRQFRDGAMQRVAVEFPGSMTDEQSTAFRNAWAATYGGVDNRKLPLVLTENAKVSTLNLTAADAQLIETRKFDKTEICVAFRVPPHMLGDTDKASSWGTGIEQMGIYFVQYTLRPHLVRWQDELNRKLFRRAGLFVEFDTAALLKGDSKAEAEYLRAALGGPGTGNGWITLNEARRVKNLPPLEGGDKPYNVNESASHETPAAATAA